jgi:sulfide dehydrogenase cytochrome subunit
VSIITDKENTMHFSRPGLRLTLLGTLLLLTMALGLTAPAMAAGAITAGQRLAATCAGCHGTNGAASGDALPSLAGQPKDALNASLIAFKGGKRPSTVMQQIARGYSDEQIALIAAYFAAQKTH